MKPKQGLDVCYNVPIAVDNNYTLIVEHEGTQEVTALDPLAPRAKRAKATLATEQLEAVADRGYYNGEEGKKGFADGIGP